MADREKVISALHCRGQDLMIDLPACDGCDYQIQLVNRRGCDFRQLCRDAIALLKEQEAVEPKQVDLYGYDEWWSLVCVCPDCKAEWMSDKADTHFCPKCGMAVKWE